MPTADTSAGAATPRKVIVVGEDQRTADAVRMAFERDGFPVVATTDLGPEVVDESVGLIVASAASTGPARAAIQQAVKARGDGGRDVPVLYVGNGVNRRDAVSAGADEVIGPPAYVRDVVTIGRMLAGQPAEVRGHWIGQLAETVGVYYLVRALASLHRSGVLTLSRGLRRGEVRFYLGEVTSAQVGGLHGQAALHQLLLWTDGRFDFRREDVVRRRQIPLLPEELLADAERFLMSVKEVSGGLSPAMVFEQDPRQMQNQGRDVPTEVHGVLRMFDGNRTLADVIEDSPYRVFETMRVASMAVQAGLLRRVAVERPKTKFRAVLALEEWLAGESKDAVAARVQSLAESGSTMPAVSSPPPATTPAPAGKGRRKKRPPSARAAMNAPQPAAQAKPALAPTPIDWGALVPRGVAVEIQGLSQVVPTQQASGEIMIPKDLGEAPATRKSTRERLESLATEARDRMFPTDAPHATVEVMSQAGPPPVSGPAIDAVPKTIQSSGMTPVSFAIPVPSSTGVPAALEPPLRPSSPELDSSVPPPEIISLPPPGDTLQIAVVPMPSAGETMRGVLAPLPADPPPQDIHPESLPPAPTLGMRRAEPLPHEPSILISPAALAAAAAAPAATEPVEDPTTPMQRVDPAELGDGDQWAKVQAAARERADAQERLEAEEWSRKERLARERAAGEEVEARARAAAAEEAAAAELAQKEADAAVAAAERARQVATDRAKAAAAHLEIAERMRTEMAERLRAESERAAAEEAAREAADKRLEEERARLESEREAHERAEVEKALVRAKEIADRMRTEAAASAKALADVERVRAAAEALVAETDAAERARAERVETESATAADAERAAASVSEQWIDAPAKPAEAEAERVKQAEAQAAAQAEAERFRQAAAAQAAQAAQLEAQAAAQAEAERLRQAEHARAEADAAARAQAAADARAQVEAQIAKARVEAEASERARVAAEERVFAAAKARQDAQTAREREAAAAQSQEAARVLAAAVAPAPAAEAPEDVTAPRPRVALEGPPALAPAVLTEDLAAAHAAVSTVVAQQAARSTTTDARTERAETAVAGVRRDARSQAGQAAEHFEEHEEQFFQQGASPTYGHPTEPAENFDDLDRGYQPSGFWDRLLGRDKKKPGKR